MNGVIKAMRRWLRNLGYDVVRYTPAEHALARRKEILDLYEVDAVLDVGANTGQYALQLREIGYKGKILSFEPLGAAWRILSAAAEKDNRWQVLHHALGDRNGQSVIHVSRNSFSSSFREMLPLHASAAPGSAYVGTEAVEVKTLDAIFDKLGLSGSNILMKLDTQGYEKNVIDGSCNSLPLIDTIELEMSPAPLYEGEISFMEMYAAIIEMGYQPVSMQDEFRHPGDGRLLQLQAVFHRFG